MATQTKSKSGKMRGKAKPAKASTHQSKTKPAKPARPQLTGQIADILERVGDGIVAFDALMNYTYVNLIGGQLLGRKPEDLIGKNYWVEYPEAKGTPFAEAYVRALETQKPIVLEDYYEPFDRWFENRIYPSEDGLTIFFTEITERKRAEQLLLAELNIMELLSAGTSLEQVLTAIVEKVEALSVDTIGSVLLLDPDGVHVRHGAAPRLPDAYNQALEGAPIGPQEGSCGTAMYLRKQVIVTDIQTDPLWVNYRELAATHGLRACWSTPVIGADGRVLASFAMYYREPRSPQDKDFELIERMTHLAQLAIERKQAEEALRVKSEELERYFENSLDLLCIADTGGYFRKLNPEWTRVLGYEISELINQPFMQFVHPQDVQATGAALGQLAAQEQVLNFTNRYRHRDGSYRWIEWRSFPMGGTIFAVARDITERRRAEEKLRLSEKRFRALIENAADMILTISADGNMNYVSPAVEPISGYGAEEVLGANIAEYIHPEDLPRALQALASRSRVAGLAPASIELRFRHKNGTWRVVEILGNNLLGDPAVAGIVLNVRDITERKRAEETLHESEVRFKAIASNTPDHILMQDRELKYTLVINPQSGLTEQDMLGKTDYDFLPKEEADRLTHAKTQVIETGEAMHFETSLISKSGQPEYFDGSYVPRLDAQGRVEGLIGYFRNVTERKQAEEQLRRKEEVLRLFVEHSPAAIAMFDREMKYIVASRRYLIDYDLGEQNLVGRSHYEIFPEIPERWKDIHRRCLAGAIERAEADPFPRTSGKMDWVRWEIRPWRESNGEIGGVILFSEVITERKQSAEALRQSNEQLRELTNRLSEVEELERRNLSRELHDRVGQTLTALNINLNIVQSQLSPDSAQKIGSRIEDSIHLVEETVARVRDVMADLHPPVLADYGLAAALRWYAEQFTRRTQIPVSVEEAGESGSRLPSHLEAVLFRVAQEALTNAARHAEAKHIRLNLNVEGNTARLRVEDDGRGFDPLAVVTDEGRGWGLRTMRERVEAVGGKFLLESSPGEGTKIFAEVTPPPVKLDRAAFEA